MSQPRAVFVAAVALGVLLPAAPAWADGHMVYTPSHRVTFEQTWSYTFPAIRQARRWIIALRQPPELPWSRDVQARAELRTSAGWKALREVRDGSKERRRLFLIDLAHKDPLLERGFTLRATTTATLCDQALEEGAPAEPVAPLTAEERAAYLAATPTFDFQAPVVRAWMDEHRLWRAAGEGTLDFARRVYRVLRRRLPYDLKDSGTPTCSRVLRVGRGECCRHGIVGTSVLRANGIPARTVCAWWAVDDKSTGQHCWGEFFLDGAGWVPYDTTLDHERPDTDDYFARHRGQQVASMIDFDWLIDAGPFGRQTVFAIDAYPVYWGQGGGSLADPKCETTASVRVLRKFR